MKWLELTRKVDKATVYINPEYITSIAAWPNAADTGAVITVVGVDKLIGVTETVDEVLKKIEALG
jgi:uncharacterized protein YlzI (FlbEa/FlbD family)